MWSAGVRQVRRAHYSRARQVVSGSMYGEYSGGIQIQVQVHVQVHVEVQIQVQVHIHVCKSSTVV